MNGPPDRLVETGRQPAENAVLMGFSGVAPVSPRFRAGRESLEGPENGAAEVPPGRGGKYRQWAPVSTNGAQ